MFNFRPSVLQNGADLDLSSGGCEALILRELSTVLFHTYNIVDTVISELLVFKKLLTLVNFLYNLKFFAEQFVYLISRCEQVTDYSYPSQVSDLG